jgi:hypothetical protein
MDMKKKLTIAEVGAAATIIRNSLLIPPTHPSHAPPHSTLPLNLFLPTLPPSAPFPSQLFKGCPGEREFVSYMEHIRALGFEETPDYAYLKGLFQKLYKAQGYPADNLYDWTEIKEAEARKEAEDKAEAELQAAIQERREEVAAAIAAREKQRKAEKEEASQERRRRRREQAERDELLAQIERAEEVKTASDKRLDEVTREMQRRYEEEVAALQNRR